MICPYNNTPSAIRLVSANIFFLIRKNNTKNANAKNSQLIKPYLFIFCFAFYIVADFYRNHHATFEKIGYTKKTYINNETNVILL